MQYHGVRTIALGRLAGSQACMHAWWPQGTAHLRDAASETPLFACMQRKVAEDMVKAEAGRQVAAEHERERLLQELAVRDKLVAARTADLEQARLVHLLCRLAGSVTKVWLFLWSGKYGCCREACEDSARELAAERTRCAALQQQGALAAAELASCRAELSNIAASQTRKAHAKDGMVSQLIAALAAEEAGKTGALAQLRAAQSRAAQLEVALPL